MSEICRPSSSLPNKFYNWFDFSACKTLLQIFQWVESPLPTVIVWPKKGLRILHQSLCSKLRVSDFLKTHFSTWRKVLKIYLFLGKPKEKHHTFKQVRNTLISLPKSLHNWQSFANLGKRFLCIFQERKLKVKAMNEKSSN